MPAPILLGLPAIVGGIRGAIRPPTGLGPTQGFVHGFSQNLPFSKVLQSIFHVANGTTGQWSNPANNPYNHPENFNRPTVGPASPSQSPGLPSFINAYPTSFGQFPQLPGEISAGGPIAGFDSLNGRPVYNARGVIPASAPALPTFMRQAFGPTLQQLHDPLSSIGPGGTSVFNPYSTAGIPGADPTRGDRGLGTPNTVVTSVPAWAAAFSQYIASRNQL